MDAKHVFLRAIVCRDVTIDLIIGLPSIKYFDLLPILTSHLSTTPCCEVCEVLRSVPPIITPVAHLLTSTQRSQLASDRHQYNFVSNSTPNRPGPSPTPHRRPSAHSNYPPELETLFYHIEAAGDTTHIPAYTSVDDMTQTIQQLHLSDILDYDDDGTSMDGPNDIDISCMTQIPTLTDYDIGGSPNLRRRIQLLMHEYRDIFSYNVKGKAMSVPPMKFSVNIDKWESTPKSFTL